MGGKIIILNIFHNFYSPLYIYFRILTIRIKIKNGEKFYLLIDFDIYKIQQMVLKFMYLTVVYLQHQPQHFLRFLFSFCNFRFFWDFRLVLQVDDSIYWLFILNHIKRLANTHVIQWQFEFMQNTIKGNLSV